ncbi:MAG: DUF4118 domain-containing protein [Oscillospiraceae bacterium]|nr:DUF4118 domain-containing protein [Oscillospiraceae bacterium]
MDAIIRNEESGERILVCVSPSPSNRKVIAAAARMAEAFRASLTAIYVKPTGFESLSEEDRLRLESNLRFAEQNGASVATVIGDDIPVQVAEYAHVSDTTKIVVGQSGARRRHFWSKAPLTEQIILNAPDVDVYIIPDSAADLQQQKERFHISDQIRPTLKDTLITLLLLVAATGIGLLFMLFEFSEANIITVYILGVLVISVITVSPLYGVIGSLASVLLFNWFFIDPRFSFHTYEPEYAVTFAIMLISSLITGSLANRMKRNTRQAAREAFRAKVLFDTDQLLQNADSADGIIKTMARQIITLLDRDVIVYPRSENGGLGDRIPFSAMHPSGEEEEPDADERELAERVFRTQKAAGFRMEDHGRAKAQYHAICQNSYCYGVIAIYLNGAAPEPFENSVLTSILGECALALENLRNAEEKERTAVMVRNEQLRSNLLRSISHDIRTPLTSISGNASNLLSHYRQLDEDTLQQIFSDIYDDSAWLIGLVENLLSISRIENGQMDLHLSLDVLGDVIDEALKHVDRNAVRHRITVAGSDDIFLVNMDARLITQVLSNLINNAVKYTPEGSEIVIRSGQDGESAFVTVCDNGPGIPDDVKPHVFEMFYTGQSTVADGRRGMGLGLALCRSIMEAHHGSITLRDNEPSGCCFTISLPAKEVPINE